MCFSAMRFSITPEGDNRLPLVRRLPDEQVGRLEGYNGIGKTLAATVLQICTGTQPLLARRQQAQWEGLRVGLGRLRVTAEGLDGGHRIEWRLDSRLWPADVTKAIGVTDEWFDVEIDGKAAALDDVRRLLRVERIAGNVGLLETLADEADAERAKVEAFSSRIEERREAVEQLVGTVANFLRPVEPGAFTYQSHRLEEAQRTVENIRAELEARRNRVRALQDAIVMRDQLAEYENAGPNLDEEIMRLAGQIADRQHSVGAVLSEIKALSPTAAQSAEAAKALRSANTSLKRANTRVTNAWDTLATVAAKAGLDEMDRAAEELTIARKGLDEAEQQRKALTSRPELLELLTGIDGPIRIAQSRDLGEQVLFSDPVTPGREWTVDEVYEATGKRREAVTATPVDPAVEEVEGEVDRLSERVLQLQRIPRVRSDLETAQRALRTATRRVKELNDQAQNPASGKIEALEEQLEGLHEELITLAAAQARLERRREELTAGRSPDDLSSALRQRLGELELAELELESALHEELGAAETLQAAYVHADHQVRDETATLASLSEQVNRLVAGLHSRDEFEWFAQDSGELLPAQSAPFESKLDALEQLAAVARRADERLEGIRQAPLSVTFALDALARDLRGARDDATPPLMPAMTTWLEARAAEWFAEESVRQFVLAEADGEIVVDLEGRRVLAHGRDGTPIAKPLEGFSSGEQAFAFTQAQLALLDHRSSGATAQRLVILDEFGAFIALKGRKQLAAQLRRWAESHPSDQILVILPTNQDYEAMAASATKDRRKQFLEHASDLAETQYFVAPLEDQ